MTPEGDDQSGVALHIPYAHEGCQQQPWQLRSVITDRYGSARAAGYSTIWKPDPFDFEPRIGLAWDITGKGTTVVRVGVGIIHETWTLETFEGQFKMQDDGSTASKPSLRELRSPAGLLRWFHRSLARRSGGGTITLGSAGFTPNQLCWDPSIRRPLPQLAPAQATVLSADQRATASKCGDGVAVTLHLRAT